MNREQRRRAEKENSAKRKAEKKNDAMNKAKVEKYRKEAIEEVKNMKNSTKSGEMMRHVILSTIITYIKEHGYPPTIREICGMTGLKSTSAVHRHLEKMLELGMIETDADKVSARAIRVPGFQFVDTRLFGSWAE